MPLYEFQCRTCGRRFESLIRLGQEGSARCPSCGGPDIRKLVSGFGIGGGSSRIKASGSGCATCSSGACSTCK